MEFCQVEGMPVLSPKKIMSRPPRSATRATSSNMPILGCCWSSQEPGMRHCVSTWVQEKSKARGILFFMWWLQPARLETRQQVLLARLMPSGGEGRRRTAVSPSRPQKYLILLNTYAKALSAAFFHLPDDRRYR